MHVYYKELAYMATRAEQSRPWAANGALPVPSMKAGEDQRYRSKTVRQREKILSYPVFYFI